MSGCDGGGVGCGCGCCAAAPEGEAPRNRPGLPAIAYRIGTHPVFLARMLRRLSTREAGDDEAANLAPLRALTTRQGDDPIVALLDAWAVTADVLTFYQERIANEGFIRTATERRSVRELARAIGYELKPGVSATAYLAFTVETAGGSPPSALVPAGTRVQSVPVERALPQPFETGAEFTAQGAWNELRPRLREPQRLDPGAATVWLAGRVEMRPGAWVCFVTPNGSALRATPRRVTAVAHDDAAGRTRLDLAAAAVSSSPAPAAAALPAGKPVVARLKLDQGMIGTLRGKEWRERDLGAMVALQRWNPLHLSAAMAALRPVVAGVGTAAAGSVLHGVYAFGVRSAPFGNNAPRWDSLPVTSRYDIAQTGVPSSDVPPYPQSWDGSAEPAITLRSQSEPPAAPAIRPTYASTFGGLDFFAERTLPEVGAGSLVMLESTAATPPPPSVYRVEKTGEASLTDFSLSARCTGFDVAKVAATDGEPGAFKLRSTTIHAASTLLALADMPIETPVGEGTAEAQQITLDTLVLGLAEGQPVAIRGDRADLPGVAAAEVATLREAIHAEGLTTLRFTAPLAFRYTRASVRISANVVKATHGETVGEVLGSGDGAVANQSFRPRRAPLTHVAAATATGTESTLEVRVDGVLWEQVPSLYGQGPAAEVYALSLEEEGRARAVFGDGEMGARLPTGAENVAAVYRVGVGTPGMVGAGTLSLMQTRPLGIREVTNPLPASGAEDAEALEGARENAPRTVLTLDRIVSLRDYEDFAASFAGVGKAQAVAIPMGEHALVHLTVADVYGEEVPPGAPLRETLRAAVESLRDPGPPFVLESFERLFFNVAATLRVDPRHTEAAVLEAARLAVLDAFSFARRAFGQGVTAAEVVTVLQGVAGVVAVDLDALYSVEDPDAAAVSPGLGAVLAAGRARRDPATGAVLPAQLLLANPVGVSLTPAAREAA